MHARNLTFHLKPNQAAAFTKTMEKDVLPVLRKQNGFKDVITIVNANNDAIAMSLWDKKENAEIYSRDTYAQVLKSLDGVVEGKPVVGIYEVSNSSFHSIGASRN